MNAYRRLSISIAIASTAHFALFALPNVFRPKPSGQSAMRALDGLNSSQPIKVKFTQQKRPSNVEREDKNIAARVTSNDETLKMNNGSEPEKQVSQLPSGSVKTTPKSIVHVDPNAERAKYVHQKQAKQKSLKQVIQELSRQKKETLKSTMTRRDYLRFKQSMKYGRMQGVPTPNLAFAYKDLSEILTVHNVFGMKVVALDPQRPSTVVEVVGLGTENSYCQKIDNFNGKAYSNRIYRRTEPFFTKFMPECQKQLTGDSAILISMTPANTDAYFRYKISEVIKRNGYKADRVSTAIAKFYKTSFSAMILVIEKLHMKDGTIKEVNDFEKERITSD